MEKQFLFVYGTLRSEFPLDKGMELKKNLVWKGKGTVQAKLYDLGAYPAVLIGEESDWLRGEIYEILQPEKAFDALDTYEGDEYSRKLTEVQLSDSSKLTAWMYWYNKNVNEANRIEENDYLTYLKNKKDRFL